MRNALPNLPETSAATKLPAKQRIRESFERAAASYDAAAVVQREVCRLLLADFALHAQPAIILDAGCGTGYGAQLLRRRWPQASLIAVDFAPAMLALAHDACEFRIAADIEQLPCHAAVFAVWWSNLTVQWCDADRVLVEAQRVLHAGGALALSTLGPETFHEMRAAFAGIDGYQHTLTFVAPETLERSLLRAGFSEIRTRRQTIRVHYPDLRTLLRAVKDIGANSLGEGARSGLFGRRAWLAVQAAYERFRTAEGLPASYDVILAYARK